MINQLFLEGMISSNINFQRIGMEATCLTFFLKFKINKKDQVIRCELWNKKSVNSYKEIKKNKRVLVKGRLIQSCNGNPIDHITIATYKIKVSEILVFEESKDKLCFISSDRKHMTFTNDIWVDIKKGKYEAFIYSNEKKIKVYVTETMDEMQKYLNKIKEKAKNDEIVYYVPVTGTRGGKND